MSFQFGSGNLWATQTYDGYGNAVALPSPIQFGVLQDVSFDMSFDEKMLYGQNQFPVDAGRGKGKISIKAKMANLNMLSLSALFFGQSYSAGMVETVVDLVGQTIAATVAITPSGSYTWASNLAVRTAFGDPFIRVASAPAVGQYSLAVVSNTATYTFNASDVGKTVFIDYKVTSSTLGNTSNIANLPMGAMPFFSLEFSQKRNGKGQSLTFPNVTSSKLAFSTKQDDFLVPELDMQALADSNTGRILTYTSFA